MTLALMLTGNDAPTLRGQQYPPAVTPGSDSSRSQSFDPRFVCLAFSAPLNCAHQYPANQVSKSSPSQLSSACRQQFRNQAPPGLTVLGCRSGQNRALLDAL